MLSIIAIIPGLLAAYVAFKYSPHRAFLVVYLPVLLLMPDYYRWITPGLPDPTFSQSAIVGVAAGFFARGMPGYRFSFTDILVFGFAGSVGYSEFLASGYSDAQNLIFNMLAWVVLPYLMAKSLIEPGGLRLEFARRLTLITALLGIVSVYEFKFGATPWRLFLDPFFPGQGRGWVTTFRWGFARIAGPYGHAILAGIIFMVAFRIARWLEWSGGWEPRFRRLPWLRVNKATLISLAIFGAVIMSMVRGPWIGGILAAGLVAIGRAKNRGLAFGAAIAIIVFVGMPLVVNFINYASVGRENAQSVAQETAAYRFELIEKYTDYAKEKAVWGWGLTQWPKVNGMPSIDNYYLLLFLMHGAVATLFLLALFLYMLVRLLAHSLSRPAPMPRGSSLGFTLASIYLLYGFSIATVYLGLQAMPLLFIITGWADGYLRSGFDGVGDKGSMPVAEKDNRPYRFKRVLD